MCRGMAFSYRCPHCNDCHGEVRNCTCPHDMDPDDMIHRTAGGVHSMACQFCKAAMLLQQRWRYLRQRRINIANTFFQRWWDQHHEDPAYPIAINRVCDSMIQDGLDPLEVQTLRDNMYDELAQ